MVFSSRQLCPVLLQAEAMRCNSGGVCSSSEGKGHVQISADREHAGTVGRHPQVDPPPPP
jgi:hypothetical protein